MEMPSRAPLAHQHCHTRRTSESRRRSKELRHFCHQHSSCGDRPFGESQDRLRFGYECHNRDRCHRGNSKSRDLDPLFVNGRIKDVVLGEPCRDLVYNQVWAFTEAYCYHTPSTPFQSKFRIIVQFYTFQSLGRG